MIHQPTWNQPTRNMKARLAIKFPHPSGDQMPGVCPGGGGLFKLRFDWYITMQLMQYRPSGCTYFYVIIAACTNDFRSFCVRSIENLEIVSRFPSP